MRVVGLYLYPVKSLAGIGVKSVSFGRSGTIIGDRAWALQDAHSGLVLSCKCEPRLLHIGTSASDGEVLVHVPGVDSPVPVTNSADVVSAWLGRQVRPLPLDRVTTSLSFDFGFPLESDLGSLADNGGYTHVVTTGTVRAVSSLCAKLGEPHSDAAALRRLRPNIVVGNDTSYGEDGWRGAILTSARAELRVVATTERCTMVDHSQPGMRAVPGLLDRLRADHGTAAGNYVVGREGDQLQFDEALQACR